MGTVVAGYSSSRLDTNKPSRAATLQANEVASNPTTPKLTKTHLKPPSSEAMAPPSSAVASCPAGSVLFTIAIVPARLPEDVNPAPRQEKRVNRIAISIAVTVGTIKNGHPVAHRSRGTCKEWSISPKKSRKRKSEC